MRGGFGYDSVFLSRAGGGHGAGCAPCGGDGVRIMTDRFRALLDSIPVLPFLFEIETDCAEADAGLLHGVWGDALHDLDTDLYARVFEGEGPEHLRRPKYALWTRAADEPNRFLMEWCLFGSGATAEPALLLRAWDLALKRGLGRNRSAAAMRECRVIGPDGAPSMPHGRVESWPLGRAQWPLPDTVPCRLRFDTPLRILRPGKILIDQPALEDIIGAVLDRVEAYLPPERLPELMLVRPYLIELARRTPQRPFCGQAAEMHRWSAKQRQLVSLKGRTGHLDLPEGPGLLSAILAAALHLGAGQNTTTGLGRMQVEAFT